MGGTSTMKHSGASGAMQRVKCRTGGRSPLCGVGMRSVPPRAGGPGEDRHLTRVGAQYAQGCWWGALPPTGCPAASERGLNVRTT